ncbi:YrhC family protein [Bacillus taeanensis]|uniref:YrhC family protein n=1 Tax=Bacillus taeanensis TaxID=273032 RepID=A0A366Y2M9_9BACI|nr:YrhC family protein [Bacillus taeanensis]RBW70461.1 hypothetical protein DS031_05385 [Bacillus taeanensis]
MKQMEKELHEKVVDYSRFSSVLFCLGAFLSFGLYIPFEGKDNQQLIILIVVITLLMLFSVFFLHKANLIRKGMEHHS